MPEGQGGDNGKISTGSRPRLGTAGAVRGCCVRAVAGAFVVVYYLAFHYVPMVGAVAFRDFGPIQGITRSDSDDFERTVGNTLIIRFLSLAFVPTTPARILPFAISTFNLIIRRTSFEGVPASLDKSARMVGAGLFTT